MTQNPFWIAAASLGVLIRAAPKYGTWGYDLGGEETAASPSKDWRRGFDVKSTDPLYLPPDQWVRLW